MVVSFVPTPIPACGLRDSSLQEPQYLHPKISAERGEIVSQVSGFQNPYMRKTVHRGL